MQLRLLFLFHELCERRCCIHCTSLPVRKLKFASWVCLAAPVARWRCDHVSHLYVSHILHVSHMCTSNKKCIGHNSTFSSVLSSTTALLPSAYHWLQCEHLPTTALLPIVAPQLYFHCCPTILEPGNPTEARKS